MTPLVSMISLLMAFYLMFLWSAEPTNWRISLVEATAGISSGLLMIGGAMAIQQGRPWSLSLTTGGVWLLAVYIINSTITYWVYAYDAKAQQQGGPRIRTFPLHLLAAAGGFPGR